MKPIIGITPSLTTDVLAHGSFNRFTINRNYVDAVLAAGGIPIILPPQDDHVEDLIESVDGLLFTGGADLRPSLYGDQSVHPATYEIDDLRDRFEIGLLRAAVERDIPFLCICRGIQVMNVALGGTLIQDVPDQYSREIEHRQHKASIPASEPGHVVDVAPGSLLADLFAAATVGVNSFHHQAIRDVASSLDVVGRSPDDLVEAVVLPGRSCALGVQWHPELMFTQHEEHLVLFTHLVETAKAQRLLTSLAVG